VRAGPARLLRALWPEPSPEVPMESGLARAADVVLDLAWERARFAQAAAHAGSRGYFRGVIAPPLPPLGPGR